MNLMEPVVGVIHIFVISLTYWSYIILTHQSFLGLYVHGSKKTKISKQMQESSPESTLPLGVAIPASVASQISNMPNSSKFFKAILNRDCGRKNKSLKVCHIQNSNYK